MTSFELQKPNASFVQSLVKRVHILALFTFGCSISAFGPKISFLILNMANANKKFVLGTVTSHAEAIPLVVCIVLGKFCVQLEKFVFITPIWFTFTDFTTSRLIPHCPML